MTLSGPGIGVIDHRLQPCTLECDQPRALNIARGNLKVTWKTQAHNPANAPPGSPAAPTQVEPFAETIEAENIELLSRVGETPFHHVVVGDILPEYAGANYLEPSLQLYDLNGDGLFPKSF